MIRHLPVLIMVGLLTIAGCAKRPEPQKVAASADAGPVVDVELMAYLSEARALHHEANLREAENDVPKAIAALERLSRADRPHAPRRLPEVEEVLADTYARLAELRLGRNDFTGALHDVEEGVTHAPEPTYFRGHLFEVEGLIEEARAASLADAGKADEAKRARERALAVLHEAVEIQEKVVAASLGDAGPGERRP
jgi:tetratricopeptide (TPR) repeat protein